MGQQQGDLRIVQDVCEPVRRIIGIQRQIRGAGLQYAQHRDDHVRRAFHADADQRLRPHAISAEQMCKPVGAAVEFGIGERLTRDLLVRVIERIGIEDQRRVGGHAFGGLFEQAVDAGVVRERLRSCGPVAQDLLAFGVCQPRDIGQGALRRGGDACQYGLQVAGHAADGRGVVVRDLIRQLDAQLLARRDGHGQRVVRAGVRAVALDAQPLRLPRLLADRLIHRIVLEHQDVFEQRQAARDVAPPLDIDQGAVLELAARCLPAL